MREVRQQPLSLLEIAHIRVQQEIPHSSLGLVELLKLNFFQNVAFESLISQILQMLRLPIHIRPTTSSTTSCSLITSRLLSLCGPHPKTTRPPGPSPNTTSTTSIFRSHWPCNPSKLELTLLSCIRRRYLSQGAAPTHSVGGGFKGGCGGGIRLMKCSPW